MPRFYVPFPDAEAGKPIVLPSESVHHAMRVLRLRQDDTVEVFNGRGLCANLATAKLSSFPPIAAKFV